MSFIAGNDAEIIPPSQPKSFRLSLSHGAEYIPPMENQEHGNADFKLRLRLRMAEKKMSAQGLSLTANLSRDTVRKLLSSDSQLPQSKTLTALARALGTTEQWLLSGEGSTEGSPAGPDPVPFSAGQHRQSRYTEILGAAAGSHGDGAFQFIHEGFRERILIPQGIAHLPDVYAINVTGDSMFPEHKNGEVRFVLPSIQPQLGDTVVVEFQREPGSDPEAMIGHLLKRQPTVRLGKINPENVIELPTASIMRLHRIATYDELAGRGFL